MNRCVQSTAIWTSWNTIRGSAACPGHVGYIRHDCDVAGCGIVVVPQNTADQAYAETIADQLAETVWNKRHEFHYTGLTAHPDEALKMALGLRGKTSVHHRFRR